MEIFPLFLLRIAGLPLSYLEDLRWSSSQTWLDLLEVENQIQSQKETLLPLLSDVIGQHPDYKAKNTLANLYKDLLQNRRLRVDKYQKLLEYSEAEKSLFASLQKYQSLLVQLEEKQQQWLSFYKSQLPLLRQRLQVLLNTEPLLLALPFSSLSTHHRLQNYLAKTPADFRKKEWQTERTALQFLSRIMSKTSPFSSYTSLSLQSLEDSGFQIEATRKVRLNNYLMAFWQAVLENIPEFYRQLHLKINPSLRPQEGQYTFLLNSRNIESLQQVEQNPLLDTLIDRMKHRPMRLEEVLAEALTFVDAELEDLENFILDLVHYGLLEWHWPMSGRDPRCLEKLREMIATKTDFPLKANSLQLLDQLDSQSMELEKADAARRVDLLQEMKQELQSFFDQHLPQNSKAEEASFGRFLADEFNWKPEKIAYEDVSSTHAPYLNKASLEPIVKELDQVVQCLYPLFTTPWQQAVLQHFEEHYPQQTSVDLLSFYDSFFRTEKTLDYQQELKESIVQAVLGKLRAGDFFDSSRGVCHLSLTDLQKLLPVSDSAEIALVQGQSQAALLHCFRHSDATLRAFVEANVLGNGKLMGRFLHLFPEAVTQQIRQWNLDLQGTEKWIEIVDASYFNANLYPTLLPYEIASPGSQNILPPEKQVAVTELEIVKEGQHLYLRHQGDGQKVKVFNFGLEAIDNRSAMYRLLYSFSYQVPTIDLLAQLTDAVYGQKLSEGVLHFPRLAIGQYLVLKRRRWFFPQAILPTLTAGVDGEALFFKDLQHWRRKWALPDRVFIRIQPVQIPGMAPTMDQNEIRQSDDYKPQYLDFDQVLLVQLFGRLLRRVGDYLEVEEMLPNTNEVLPLDGEAHAVEILVEWKRQTGT